MMEGENLYSFYYRGENPTVDLIVINPLNEILLIRRSHKSVAHPGMLAFPGGFIDSLALEGELFRPDLETPQAAALRELSEETNLVLPEDSQLIFIGEYVGNNRDPRDNATSWTKSHAFLFCIDKKTYDEQKHLIRGLDDADEAKWVPIEDALDLDLAFDHKKILKDALKIWTHNFKK